ncbi:uncharacterized protein METZ01_LOCUS302474, partial [marine metagenome]
VSEGSIARFTVAATGTGPLSYQWYYAGTPIDGADSSVFEIGIVKEINRGFYQAEVRNEAGRVRSSEAKLNVSVMPKLTRQPEDTVILAGSTMKLQVGASGTEPLTYNWYRRGGLYQSGGPDLLIENMSPDDAGLYQVEVVNAVGSVKGSIFEVEVQETVNIDIQPADTKANEGGAAVFRVVASGTAPFSYQWFHNGEAVDGETGSQLRILGVEDSHRGVYNVDIGNVVGTVRSESAKLKVIIPPMILKQPNPFTGREGDQLVLRVASGGSGPLTYKWYKDGEMVLESDIPVLKIDSTIPQDSGAYTVVVGNSAGNIESDETQVFIYQPVLINQQPVSVRAISGDTTVLSVEAVGSEPLAYQWLFNNDQIDGANGPELKVVNV